VLWPRVVEHFGEHFQVMTGDAGLCAAENAALVLESKKHYLLGLKGNQPTLHDYAVVAIASKQGPPRARTEDRAHGETVVRELWTHALWPGEVDFPGARLLVSVRQTHLKKDGTQSVEWRYFVTSLSTVELAALASAGSGRARSFAMLWCTDSRRCRCPHPPEGSPALSFASSSYPLRAAATTARSNGAALRAAPSLSSAPNTSTPDTRL
jgi:hypothetical protein